MNDDQKVADDKTARDMALRRERREELGQAEFERTMKGGAVMLPRNGRELMDFANMMAASGPMVRDFYRNNAGACAALIMMLQPYGFNPFLVCWKTYRASKNDDAPIAFEAQLVNAMVRTAAPIKGNLEYHFSGEGESRAVKVVGTDRETGKPLEYQSPPKSKISVQNSPLWKSDTDQQLCYYGVRAWARRWFPEILMGIYTPEEIDSSAAKDITPQETGFAALGSAARQAAAQRSDVVTSLPAPEDRTDLERVFSSGFLVGSDSDAVRADCPHTDDPERAAAWFDGFDKARGE